MTADDLWLDDMGAGRWIELDDRPGTVAALVPRTFAAIARVFHPLFLRGHGRDLRWDQVAAVNQRRTWPQMRLVDVLVRDDEEDVPASARLLNGQSTVGVLPEAAWRALLGVMRPFTSSDALVVGYWEGHGVEEFSGRRPLLELAGRRHVLAELPLDAPHASHSLNPGWSPNVVWPHDRAWFWHTDIDQLSTYVAASADAVAAVVACPDLEASRVEPDDAAIP